MSRNRCILKSCRQRGQENESHHIFSLNEASVKVLQNSFPQMSISSSSKLCSRHFDDNDIVKGKTIQNQFYPHKLWTLKAVAIPKHYLIAGKLLHHFKSVINFKNFLLVDEPLKARKRQTEQQVGNVTINKKQKGIFLMLLFIV